MLKTDISPDFLPIHKGFKAFLRVMSLTKGSYVAKTQADNGPTRLDVTVKHLECLATATSIWILGLTDSLEAGGMAAM